VRADTSVSGHRPIIDPIPDNLIREPIEYLFADHVRQRSLCGMLKSLAERGNAEDALLMGLLAYLEVDHPNHMADEEQGLFPLLQPRLASDSGMTQLLADMEQQHRRDSRLGREIADGFRALLANGGGRMPDALRASIHAFIAGVIKHLSVEDERLLPIARTTLSDGELEQMGRAMAGRRGIDFPD